MTPDEAYEILTGAGFVYQTFYAGRFYHVAIHDCGAVSCEVYVPTTKDPSRVRACALRTKRNVTQALEQARVEQVLELCP